MMIWENRVPLPDLGDLEPYMSRVDLGEDFPAFWRQDKSSPFLR